MNRSYKDMYYVKKLYMSAGMMAKDYTFTLYKNLVDKQQLYSFLHHKLLNQNVFPCYDVLGGAEKWRFDYFINLYKNTENMFIIKYDLTTLDSISGVYCNGKFIVNDHKGDNLEKFYWRTEKKDFDRIKIAEEFFCKSGEYCHCKNDMV